jgi:hypothetical protein
MICDSRRPLRPEITSPVPEGVEGIAATDVHMELSEFFDPNGDAALESAWEIWDVAREARVWVATGRGLELSHVHLSNGRYEGPLATTRALEFDYWYRLRARYRDSSGDPESEWSEWSEWRHFKTAAFGIPPLSAGEVRAAAERIWTDEAGTAIDHPGLVLRVLRAPLAGEEDFVPLLVWRLGPMTANFAESVPSAPVQIRIENSGDSPISLPRSRLRLPIVDGSEWRDATVYLPSIQLTPLSAARFWVSRNGATFTALATEIAPAYTRPARETEEAWVVPAGYFVEEVTDGLTLPTQVIVTDDNAPEGLPRLLVMELKGRIWAVDRNAAKWIYADNLIEFSSPQPSSNAGQVGLGGMALHPDNGDLYVTRTYRSPAPPIEWSFDAAQNAWQVFLPTTAAWSAGSAETKVVRYRDLPADGTPWSFSARIEYPRVNGNQLWTAGTAFGLVAYRDKDNAVFFNFQSNRHLIELLKADQRTLELERAVTPLAGWLRIDYDAGRMTFFYRSDAAQDWSQIHTIEELPFVPLRAGINGRNFARLVGRATFSDIRSDGALVDAQTLLDDTDQNNGTWLHNQVIRLHSNDGGRTAAELSVVLDMPDDISHESHQIQDIDVAPDGTLFVSVGDGFDPLNARDLTTFLGKILRIQPDGSAPPDNPFYDPQQPDAPVSYVYNYGIRNTYGMVVRRSDGRLFCSENGPSRDRLFTPEVGWDMGYDGSDRSILTNALWTWAPSNALVGIEVMQSGAFPHLHDWIFVASAGQDYTQGISRTGKRIHYLQVDSAGRLSAGPYELLRYEGTSRATVIGLAAGWDGLYFTTLYNTDPAGNAFVNGRLLRVVAR